MMAPMSHPAPPPARPLFRPDAFFVKPWRGWGVVRDGKSRILGRYEASGQGKVGSRSALTEQTIVFEDGSTVTTEWDIATDDEAHFFARDVRTGVEARGRQMGTDFHWSFASPVKTPVGTLKTRTDVVYTMVEATTAFSFAETRLLGRLVSSYTTFYRQV